MSFQINGDGFVQDSKGRVLLRVTDGGKRGLVYAHMDNHEWSWNHYEGTTLAHADTTVEVPLSPELGVRYDVVGKCLEVYFLCQRVRQKIINGFNKAEVGVITALVMTNLLGVAHLE